MRRYFEKKSKDVEVFKVLMVSDDPNDVSYSEFLNALDLQLAWPAGTRFSVRAKENQLSILS